MPTATLHDLRDQAQSPPVQSRNATEVRLQLDRMLSHPAFRRSDRLRRFLRCVVEAWLEGREGTLKESVIAVEAFDKDGTFDPRLDPIVRVEANRLRSRIDAYYSENPSDPIRIGLGKPGYRPVIQATPRRAQTETVDWRHVDIAVLPLRDLSQDQSQAYLCEGIAEQVSGRLYGLAGFRVVANTSARLYSQALDVRRIGQDLGVGLVLEGSLCRSERAFRFLAGACQTSNGLQVWSNVYDSEPKDSLLLGDEVAGWIVESLCKLREAAIGSSRPLGESPALRPGGKRPGSRR